MKLMQDCTLTRRRLSAAMSMSIGVVTFSIAADIDAQPDPVPAKTDSGSPLSVSVLPLEESASRGVSARDPSDIVKCKDEYWVFYTGRGVASYHSRDLVKWERG